MPDHYLRLPLEQRIGALRDGEITHHGQPVGSTPLTVQPSRRPAVADDIMTRLLNHPHYEVSTRPCDWCAAINEIERLVRKLDELDYYIEHLSTCATHYGKLRYCTCGLEEARRG